MAGPLAGVAIRYVAQRVGGFAVKKIDFTAVVTAVDSGVDHMGHQMRQSTRGEHSQLAGHLKTRKSMRGGSAQRGNRRTLSTFRRDEERYRGRRY